MKFFKAAVPVCAVLCTLISVFCPRMTVKADSFRYAYVDENVTDAYICTGKDLGTSVFAIPDTYCVEILKDEGEWYYCRYARDEGAYVAVRGYCLKEKLKLIEEPLEKEYLNLTIGVNFSADKSSPMFPFEIELMLPYYGKGKLNASDLICVYYGSEFRYVADDVPQYEKNPLPKPVISTDVTEKGENGNATLITAVVITAVAVIAVAVLYFASKKPKLPPKLPPTTTQT